MQVPPTATMQGQAVYSGGGGVGGWGGVREMLEGRGSETGREAADSVLLNQFSLWAPGA